MYFADDLPSKSQIFDCWKDRLRGLGFSIDWGEPSCWACGYHYGTQYDIRRPDAGWEEIFRCWDSIPLQRCHIIARSLGGTNDAGNIFLMCAECHDLAPNTRIPEIFFEWARTQNSFARESSKIRVAFESFGIDAAVQEELSELMTSEKFKSWASGKFGLHWPQSGMLPCHPD
jgi:5-methylcytosine-specific restriction endonuclease McrA